MIDTLKVSEDLQAGGFSDTQSRTLAHAIANTRDELATKGDIAILRADIDALKGSNTMLRWMVGMLYPLVVAILISLIFR